MIHKVFDMLDRLAGKWLDMRMDALIKSNPDMAKFELHKAEYRPGSAEIIAFAPSVVVLAEQAAKLLNAQHVENYLEFDLMPRVDRHIRPIRVTIQWADKLSPAKKNTLLQGQLDRLARTAKWVLNDIYEFERPPEGQVLEGLEKQLQELGYWPAESEEK